MQSEDRVRFRDTFINLTIAAFKAAFGQKGDQLTRLFEFMSASDADHFSYAYDRALDGMVVLLLTNLRDVFHMETDVDLQERLKYAYFRHEDPEAYFLLKMNPLVNATLLFASPPQQTKVTARAYALIREAETMWQAQTLEEIAALRLLRMKGNRALKFEFVEGELSRATIERDEPSSADVEDLLAEDPFQSIEVIQSDGRVRRIKRRLTRKLPSNLDGNGKRLPLYIRLRNGPD